MPTSLLSTIHGMCSVKTPQVLRLIPSWGFIVLVFFLLFFKKTLPLTGRISKTHISQKTIRMEVSFKMKAWVRMFLSFPNVEMSFWGYSKLGWILGCLIFDAVRGYPFEKYVCSNHIWSFNQGSGCMKWMPNKKYSNIRMPPSKKKHRNIGKTIIYISSFDFWESGGIVEHIFSFTSHRINVWY